MSWTFLTPTSLGWVLTGRSGEHAVSPPMSDRPVCVLGTGTMGAPMARNLAAAGLPVVAWNRTREKAEKLAGDGIRVAESPAAGLAEAGLLITMLADGPAIEAVLADGALASTPDDAIWVQMSTVGVEAAARLADLAAKHGVEFVDAPVLGSVGPAERGELVVLASGPDAARERCGASFDAVGRRTLWLGPAGAGSRLKVVVNAWLMAMMATLAETVALAERLEIDFDWFFDATDRGALAAAYTELYGAAMVARDLPVTFPLELATKDTSLALAAAGDAGLHVLEGTRRQFQQAEDLGLGQEDWAAVVRAAAGEEPQGAPRPGSSGE